MANLKAQVKTTLLGKIKSAIIKPKQGKAGFLKRINIPGIIAVIIVLSIIQLGVGLYASPALTTFIVEQVNKNTPAKIYIANCA